MLKLSPHNRTRAWWALFAVGLVLLVWAVVMVARMRAQADILFEKTLPALQLAGDMCENGYEIETKVAELVARPQGDPATAVADLDNLLHETSDLIAAYNLTVIHETDRANLAKVSRTFSAYANEVGKLAEARRAGGKGDLAAMLAQSNEFRRALSDLRDFRHARAQERIARSGSDAATAFRLQLLLLSAAGGGLFAMLAAALVLRRLSDLNPSDF